MYIVQYVENISLTFDSEKICDSVSLTHDIEKICGLYLYHSTLRSFVVVLALSLLTLRRFVV